MRPTEYRGKTLAFLLPCLLAGIVGCGESQRVADDGAIPRQVNMTRSGDAGHRVERQPEAEQAVRQGQFSRDDRDGAGLAVHAADDDSERDLLSAELKQAFDSWIDSIQREKIQVFQDSILPLLARADRIVVRRIAKFPAPAQSDTVIEDAAEIERIRKLLVPGDISRSAPAFPMFADLLFYEGETLLRTVTVNEDGGWYVFVPHTPNYPFGRSPDLAFIIRYGRHMQ